MTKRYTDRPAVVTKPTRSRSKPGLSLLIAVLVLIITAACLLEGKRRAQPKVKPVETPIQPTPEQERAAEAREIADAKKKLNANKKRGYTNQSGRAAWQ